MLEKVETMRAGKNATRRAVATTLQEKVLAGEKRLHEEQVVAKYLNLKTPRRKALYGQYAKFYMYKTP